MSDTDIVLSDRGSGLRSRDANAMAIELLVRLRSDGAKTLVVEDDVSRVGDVVLNDMDYWSYATEVLHGSDLRDPPGVVASLRGWASRYPLNAAVCSSTALLSFAGELSHQQLQSIAESTMAVIVSAFDGEGYVALFT
jgi:hypothetical protein